MKGAKFRSMTNRQFRKPFLVGEILENFLTKSGLNRRFREQRILDTWSQAVGEGIAEQTRPIRIQNGILQIRVSNSVWMQQLQYMKGMLLNKLKDHGAEDLEDLRFFMGEVKDDQEKDRGKKPDDEERKEWENLTETEKDSIKREVMNLSDPEMRKVFESVFARGLTLRKSGRKKNESEEQ